MVRLAAWACIGSDVDSGYDLIGAEQVSDAEMDYELAEELTFRSCRAARCQQK